MRAQQLSSFRVVLIVFIGALVVGCSLPFFGSSSGEADTPVPLSTTEEAPLPMATSTSPPVPTLPPPPTSTTRPTDPPPPTSPPRASATPAAQAFYLEEFDQVLTDWGLFFMSGDEDLAEVYTDEGRLSFYLDGEDIYAYLMYEAYYYTDVMLTAVVENRGYNNNNVSLICRYDSEEGWYEYNIANNGLYDLLYFDVRENTYQFIADGGSTAIQTGKAVNEYTMICEEETLSLYINGVETRRYDERKYALKEGLIGISVSSFNVHPIEVDVLSFEISPP